MSVLVNFLTASKLLLKLVKQQNDTNTISQEYTANYSTTCYRTISKKKIGWLRVGAWTGTKSFFRAGLMVDVASKNISRCTVFYTALPMKTDLHFQPTL